MTHTSRPELGGYRWLLLAGVWLQYCAFGVVANCMAPLVLPIERDLGLSHAAMGWVLGAWQLVFIVSAIPCGLLLDRLGPRWGLVIGGLCVALSACLRGVSDSFISLLLAVMLFGVGGPIISAGAPKLVTSWFTGASRGFAMGIYTTGPTLGSILVLSLTHPVMLPLFEQSWRSLLFFWGGVSLVSTLVWLLIASHPGLHANRLPQRDGTGLPRLHVLLGLVREPAVMVVLLMGAGVFLFSHGMNSWLPELLRVHGLTVVEAGYWASIPTAVGLAGSLLIPRFATAERRHIILMVLSFTAAMAFYLLQFEAEGMLLGGLVLLGIARSSLMTILVLILLELKSVGESYAGLASGLFFSVAEFGGLLGPVLLGVGYDISGGFELGLYLLVAVALAIMAGGYQLHRSRRVPTD